jgi:hypothetical protein
VPTVFRTQGWVAMFYSDDHEPIHVHMKKGGGEAKILIGPVRLEKAYNLKPAEVREAIALVEEHEAAIGELWNEHFN